MNVRWGMRRSQFFAVFNGVRQLAVSFHLLFLMLLLIFLLFDYDNLSLGVISDLCSSDADDMILICPSVNIVIGLQYSWMSVSLLATQSPCNSMPANPTVWQ